MTLLNQLIDILSRHRGEGHRHHPRPLPLHVIIQLVQQEAAPDKPASDQSSILEALHELEARGEIVSGAGRRFCMAPPSLVIASDSLANFRFIGDRAYLAAVHHALGSCIDGDPRSLSSPLDPAQARLKLSRSGVGLQTWDELLRTLPTPSAPSSLTLRHAVWNRDPFQLFDHIEHYKPSPSASQRQRWVELYHAEGDVSPLLRLPDQTLLWREDNHLYEISPDVALLAMFALDRDSGNPLLVPWQDATGRLDLRGIDLPGAYAKLLWAISESTPETWRTRTVKPPNRPLARAALSRLGLPI